MKPSERHDAAMRLDAMALEIPEWPEHPNRVPFSGVLTRVEVPSDRAPSGAAGHRVLLPRAVAEQALGSLLGMAVDYAPGLRGHDTRRKIGVITLAEIVGDRLQVRGYLFGKDFPDVLREMRGRAGRLGMSYEVTDVRVADSAADIWVLEQVVFTGAAILERTAAAYACTSLAAAAGHSLQALFPGKSTDAKGEHMNDKILKTLEALAQSSQSASHEMANLRVAVEELRNAQNSLLLAIERSVAAQSAPGSLETRVEELSRASEELRRQNEAMRAQAEAFAMQQSRKTIPPQVLTLLAKSGVGADSIGANGRVDAGVLDRALDGLPVEQRIAVKSQLARAGVLE
jgi:hypothetical protein